jgi:D-alanine-D-alanine ligase
MSSKWQNKKVGVLMGGVSKEREISLKTGKAVCEAIRRKGYRVEAIDCGWNLTDQIKESGIEVAFIALHGPYGEDGCVQGLLEWLQIPYTGSGVLASALAMDKAVLNRLGRDLGILLPRETVYDARHEALDSFLTRFQGEFEMAIRQEGSDRLTYPVIVKPSREGSTINVTIVERSTELKAAITMALKSDCKILIEEYIHGREVTIAVLNGKALPSIEIVPKSGFYDFQSKYTKGMTDYILPARINQRCNEELSAISEKIYRAIDCDGVVRVDFIVERREEKAYFLEVNTIPGMTETSLVPKAAAHAGISFEDLCERILEGASLKYGPTISNY